MRPAGIYVSAALALHRAILSARIHYRKLEVFLLYPRTNRHAKQHIKILLVLIHQAMKERASLFSGIHWATVKGIGHLTRADGSYSELCWSAPLCITVYLADRPYFGLGLELRGKALCVRQLQGVKDAIPTEKLRAWPTLLVSACMAYAMKVGLKEVRVYKADQDLNFDYPLLELREGETRQQAKSRHQDRMRRRYDRTAQELKFKKKKRYYVWENPAQAA